MTTEPVNAVVVATPAEHTDPGTSVPTPECHAAVRGDEISIAMVSNDGSQASANIPKRITIFRGKPFQENTYYFRDKDLMLQAIREMCGHTA